MGILEIVMRQERELGRQEGLKEIQEIIRKERGRIRKFMKNSTLKMRKNGFAAEQIAYTFAFPLQDVITFFKEQDDEKKKKAIPKK